MVLIGRLVPVAQAGTALLDDITCELRWPKDIAMDFMSTADFTAIGSTLTYIKWVQCEGPVSLISVCLPFIFHLFKGVHQHGFGYLIRGRRQQPAFLSPNYSHEGLTKDNGFEDLGKIDSAETSVA